MKKLFKNPEKVQKVLFFAMMFLLLSATAAFAEEPKPITGAKKALQEASVWLMGLIPVGAIAKLKYHSWAKSMAEGNGEVAAKHDKSMKNTLIFSGLALGADSVYAVWSNFFQ